MKNWAYAHGLGEMYEQYIAECDQIAADCESEGYPSHGANYELRVEQLQESYPELFGEDE